MREIKFRGWHKANKKYYTVSCIEFDSKCAYLEGVDDDDKIDLAFSFDEIVLEQYLNFKDDNGQEVYEGDILKFKIGDTWFEEPIYDEYQLEEYLNGGTDDCHYTVSNYILVGNIHESEEIV